MKRNYLILSATIIGLVILVNSPAIFHNIKDNFAWKNLKPNLIEENVSSIELSGYRYRKLDPLVQNEFLLAKR